jgi:NAD(P)-dependent dehydrogenase (short-subunit alcohol dehydrogenase family)
MENNPHPLIIEKTGLPRDTLAGQVAVVTGAGRGIGREAARGLAWLGARVVVAELNDILGNETRQRIHGDGGEALFIQTDISSVESVSALAAATHAAFGTASILVNNAIYIREAPVTGMSVEDWDRTVAVNLRGTFLTCRTFLPEMLAKRQGVIVNLISTEAMPGLSAYMATKQGIAAFSQTLAVEVSGQGVFVVPFGPGMVDTPGLRSVAEGLAPRLGMDREQFLSFSLHPAFAGLMPPEYAGAATAYLAAVLAEEYHGEAVTGYTVLERAGLIQPASAPDVSTVPLAPGREQSARIPALAVDLQRVLAETEAEFNRLPVFVRPLARGGFKSKTGASLADWQRLLAGLETGGAAPADLGARLARLVVYYRDVPKETARFTRDSAMLAQVAETCEERIAVVQALVKAVWIFSADSPAGLP